MDVGWADVEWTWFVTIVGAAVTVIVLTNGCLELNGVVYCVVDLLYSK